MSDISYQPITLDKRDEYLERFARCPAKASDYSFTNLWGWAEHYGLEWSFGNKCVWIRQTKPSLVHWAPVGPWNDVDWRECPYLREIGEFTRVPEPLAETWRHALGDRVHAEEARGHWDYVYSLNDLVALPGNKYHRKKNHLNQFQKRYEYTYRPLDMDCVEAALAMQNQWCLWRECEDSGALIAENEAVGRVLLNWDNLPGLMGGALFVDKTMIAYTVAEPLDDETLVIHFEKGQPEFRGVYQAINKMFLKQAASGHTWVNREQDLDDEGLRKSKLSYYPAHYMKKCAVRLG
jgi:uncharacterized protein